MLWRILTIVGAGARASAIILNWQRRRHRARGTKKLNWKRSSFMEVELQVFPPPEPQAHDYEYVHPHDDDDEESSSSLADSQLGFESLSAMTTHEEEHDTLAQESAVKSSEPKNETDHHQNSCGCNGACASLADVQIQSQSQSSTFAEILLLEENLQDVPEMKANCSEEDEAVYLLNPPQNNKSSGMHINLQSVKTSCVESPSKFEQEVSGNYAEQEEFKKQCVAQELGQTLEYGQSGSTAEQKLQNEIVEAEKPYVAKEFKEEKEIMENEFSELGMALAEEEEKLYAAKEFQEGEEGESSLKSFTCMSNFGEFFFRGFAAAGARATATILKWQRSRNRTTKKLSYKHCSFMEVEMQVYPPLQPQVHDYDHHGEEDSSSFIDSHLGYESFYAMTTFEEEHDALAEESEIKFKELDNETEHNKSCYGYHGSCASLADVDADSQSQSSMFAESLLPRANLEYVAEMEANGTEENVTNPTQKNISDMYVLEPVKNGCSNLGTLNDANFEIKLDSIYESEADEIESISSEAMMKIEKRVDTYRDEQDIKFEDGSKGIESKEEEDKVGVSSFSGLEEVSVIPASSCFGVKKHPHQNHADVFSLSESPMKISSNEIMEEELKNEASEVKMPCTEQELEQEIAEAVKATAEHEMEKESSEIGKTLAEEEELKESISKAGPAMGDQNLMEEFEKVDKPDATQGFEEECFDADTFKEDGESSFIFGGQENVGATYSYSSTEFFYHGVPVGSHRSRVSVRKSYADTNPAMQYRLLQMEMSHLKDLFLSTLFTSRSNKPPTPVHSCV